MSVGVVAPVKFDREPSESGCVDLDGKEEVYIKKERVKEGAFQQERFTKQDEDISIFGHVDPLPFAIPNGPENLNPNSHTPSQGGMACHDHGSDVILRLISQTDLRPKGSEALTEMLQNSGHAKLFHPVLAIVRISPPRWVVPNLLLHTVLPLLRKGLNTKMTDPFRTTLKSFLVTS
ncbi:hypothetical protein P7C70_g8827, partial [Phenoliferia sp. Uapishka_3]